MVSTRVKPFRRNLVSQVFAVGLGLGCLFVTASCSSETIPDTNEGLSESPSVEHTIINDTLDESPGKTQVTVNLLVPEDVSEEALRALLGQLYSEASQRSGFQYHDNPTVIGIYAYPSREHLAAGMGQWSGMVLKTPSDSEPRVMIGRAVGLTVEPEARFGYSEEERKQIYRRLVAAEDRGDAEAEEREPTDVMKQTDLSFELGDRYKDELAEELGITREQLSEIAAEAFGKNWPMS